LAAVSALIAFAPVSARIPVIGYFPSWAGTPSAIEYDKLTHINYSFVLPTNSGGLTSVSASRLNDLVTRAHAKNVKVGIAIGGWNDGNTSAFEAMSANTATRATFVKTVSEFCDTYKLDGVDMDWEYPKASSAVNYKLMMKELMDVLKPKGRYLSTAVISGGSGTGQHIHKEVFDYIDFLNIMSYDAGGDHHSSYELAVSSFDYWVRDRACPKEKAILGVPFYGRSPYTDYKEILKMDPAAASKDRVGAIAYNGLATMKKKTELALQRGGGVMIWEITQDVTGPNSLLAVIHTTVGAAPVSTNPLLAADGSGMRFAFAPGSIRYSGAVKGRYDLRVHAASGNRVFAKTFSASAGEGALAWSDRELAAGVYTLSVSPVGDVGTSGASGAGRSFSSKIFLAVP
jgi:GH18 family chitinase